MNETGSCEVLADTSGVKGELERLLGTPAKWQMLYAKDGRLIEWRVVRFPTLDGSSSAVLPSVLEAHTDTAAWVPVVSDGRMLDVFRRLDAWNSLPRFVVAHDAREHRWDPTQLAVGIVVEGQSVIGANMVIDSIVKRHFAIATQRTTDGGRHGLRIHGYRSGRAGLLSGSNVWLAPSRSSVMQATYPVQDEVWFTDEWAAAAGVRLGALPLPETTDAAALSEDASAIAGALERDRLDLLYVVGGAATMAQMSAALTIRARANASRRLTVIAVPTESSDAVNFTDVALGFRTAIEQTLVQINATHEAIVARHGLGVVEVSGASASRVAAHAGYISGLADYILLDHIENAVLADYLAARIRRNGHALLVVAANATGTLPTASGGPLPEALRKRFVHPTTAKVCAQLGMAPGASDLELCKLSGRHVVEAALAGYTSCSVNLWHGEFVLVPLQTCAAKLAHPTVQDEVPKLVKQRQMQWMQAPRNDWDAPEIWFG